MIEIKIANEKWRGIRFEGKKTVDVKIVQKSSCRCFVLQKHNI